MAHHCELRIFWANYCLSNALTTGQSVRNAFSDYHERFDTQFILDLSCRTESVEPMPQSKLAKIFLISASEPRWMVNFEYVQHEHSLISDSLVVYSMYHSFMFFVFVNYPKLYKILKIWEDALTKFNISFSKTQ